MVQAYIDPQPITEPLQDGNIEEVALAIFDDIFTDEPSYNYALLKAGRYARQLQHLIDARKKGVDIARRVLSSIAARPDSELATLLRQRDAAIATASVQAKEVLTPPLPKAAQLPEVCLPRPADDPRKDWYALWDNTSLRKISPFLADYIGYSHQVSPEGFVDFHVAGGLWALSTVAARRVCVPMADPEYTPLSIALVARTSLFAKTKTAKAGIKVLKAAGLGWLLGDDETTPQKLLADMSGHVPTNYGDMDFDMQEEVRRRMSMSGQVGWYYDEFNQLIDAMSRPGPMAEFAGLLRKMDDCPDEYKYSTRSHGQEKIEKPYLPLLANTTPANLRKHASKGGEFWNDGFWARFAFITPPQDSWRTETMGVGVVDVPSGLSRALEDWNKRLGTPDCNIDEVTDENGKGKGTYKVVRDELDSHSLIITTEAYTAYRNYRESLRNMIASNSNQDLDGSYVRCSSKALRVAALIASLENADKIDLAVWTLAQEIAEMFRRNLHELYAQVNCAQAEITSPLEEALIEYLKGQAGKPTTVRDILRQAPNMVRKLGSEAVEKMLQSLSKAGIVEVKKEGRKEQWTLTQ